MSKLLNPNIYFIIIFFIILRFLDIELAIKGAFFIIISLLLIYVDQKKIKKKFFFTIVVFLSIFFLFNEKKSIIEISSILKITSSSEEFYEKMIGIEKYSLIKKKYLNDNKKCIPLKFNIGECYNNGEFENRIITSPDQFVFNINENFTRKISKISFSNLGNLRAPFVNTRDGRINPNYIHKFETPYIIKFTNLKTLKEICFKGYLIVEYEDSKNKVFDTADLSCISNNLNIKEVVGFSTKSNNLEIYSKKRSNFDEYTDEILLLIFFIILISNINYLKLKNNLKLFIPTLLSVFIIFFISKFDLWFGVFNLFNFYFFGFEGGDGLTYINFVNDLYYNLQNGNTLGLIRGGESVFYFTPGLRYFLFVNQIISGDFYYLYFFILFFLPKIIYNFFSARFNNKIAYIVTISFLLIPVFHHLGFSYYQYIRHAYRLFPESLGYMFFIFGMTMFLNNFKENYLQMNLLFAISVFLRPNLVVSIVLIVLIKTIIERVNIFNLKKLIYLTLISLIYLFPLIHNYYFGNSLTLFTGYGSRILSLENILSKDIDFYLERIMSINLPFLILIFIPKLNNYFKIILITQFLTVFWFDMNERYYWMYWFISLTMILDILVKYKFKWRFLQKFTLN